MKSTYRLEELRAAEVWQPFADVVGLPVAMQVLDEVLPSVRVAVRVVRARDGLVVATFWWPRQTPARPSSAVGAP